MQISKSIFNIEFNIFFELLNFKIIIWVEMIVKRFNAETSNFDNNNIDKNRSMSKQNCERQNDFSQQSDVNDFSFFIIQFFWLFQNYISYQFQNSIYQNQKFQYQFFDEEKQQQQQLFSFAVLFAILLSKQFLQITFENTFDSK